MNTVRPQRRKYLVPPSWSGSRTRLGPGEYFVKSYSFNSSVRCYPDSPFTTCCLRRAAMEMPRHHQVQCMVDLASRVMCDLLHYERDMPSAQTTWYPSKCCSSGGLPQEHLSTDAKNVSNPLPDRTLTAFALTQPMTSEASALQQPDATSWTVTLNVHG